MEIDGRIEYVVDEKSLLQVFVGYGSERYGSTECARGIPTRIGCLRGEG